MRMRTRVLAVAASVALATALYAQGYPAVSGLMVVVAFAFVLVDRRRN